METIDALLQDVPIFHEMAPAHLALLAGCAKNVHFDDGAVMFREGEPADTFYLVRHGSIALSAFVPQRGPVTIETLETGEVVGWSWLFPPYCWQFDARAVGAVRATAFDGVCLRHKCDADPALGYDLMWRFGQVLVERLQWTRLRLLDVYGHSRPV
jgi:CRP-like cAMP-binding protein